MKKLVSIFLASAAVSVFALTTVKVSVPLKDKDIYKVIFESTENFLNYEGEEISGGLYGELKDPTIIQVTKKGPEAKEIVVRSHAFFMTTDHEFGDPVHEETTYCTSTLKKVAGAYTLKNTTTKCNYDPAVELADYAHQTDHPCCESDGTPIVDSNWCFDYYEEGAQFCTQYSEYGDYWDY